MVRLGPERGLESINIIPKIPTNLVNKSYILLVDRWRFKGQTLLKSGESHHKLFRDTHGRCTIFIDRQSTTVLQIRCYVTPTCYFLWPYFSAATWCCSSDKRPLHGMAAPHHLFGLLFAIKRCEIALGIVLVFAFTGILGSRWTYRQFLYANGRWKPNGSNCSFPDRYYLSIAFGLHPGNSKGFFFHGRFFNDWTLGCYRRCCVESSRGILWYIHIWASAGDLSGNCNAYVRTYSVRHQPNYSWWGHQLYHGYSFPLPKYI